MLLLCWLSIYFKFGFIVLHFSKEVQTLIKTKLWCRKSMAFTLKIWQNKKGWTTVSLLFFWNPSETLSYRQPTSLKFKEKQMRAGWGRSTCLPGQILLGTGRNLARAVEEIMDVEWGLPRKCEVLEAEHIGRVYIHLQAFSLWTLPGILKKEVRLLRKCPVGVQSLGRTAAATDGAITSARTLLYLPFLLYWMKLWGKA